MALAGPPAEQRFGQKVSYSRKSATGIDMSRAGSVTLGARIGVEQSSPVSETHLLTPKSLVYIVVVLLKNLGGRVGSRTSIQDEVRVAENVWDH